MADFEDSTSPTWDNVIDGQVNLFDAVRRTIWLDTDDGKSYRLGNRPAVLMVRPRGLHLVERHVLVDGAPISAGFFDLALYLFHNAAELVSRGSGLYCYLPKLESHLEARLWNDLFLYAEDALTLPGGTIRATVLIETIPAAFEMEEILHGCGTTRRGSTRAAGTTSSASSRRSAIAPTWCSPTVAKSRCRFPSCAPTPSSWCGSATGGGHTPSAAWRRSSPTDGTPK